MSHYLFNFTRKGAAKGRSLREQAADLVDAKLWGIGAKTPNRDALAPGDRVLLYVGAPENAFIGQAELSSPNHTWTPEEDARYPGDFDSGVAFSKAELWPYPLPMKSVLSSLELKETNPKALFFSGVTRIKQSDFETVIGVATSGPTPTPTPSPTPTPVAEGTVDLDLLFNRVEKLKEAAALDFSEYDTRAVFIDKYLEALGYTDLGDIQHGFPVDAGTFADYVVRVNDQAAIVIEAKRLGAPLGTKEAAQVVSYCANLGVRWGAVTDARHFKLYDAPVLGMKPEERLVLSVDLTNYKDREDFEARVYPELELIAKKELEAGGGLERRVAQEAVRELLTSNESKTLKALRRELDDTKAIKLTQQELADLVSELLS